MDAPMADAGLTSDCGTDSIQRGSEAGKSSIRSRDMDRIKVSKLESTSL